MSMMTKEDAFKDLDALTAKGGRPEWMLVDRMVFTGGFPTKEAKEIVSEWMIGSVKRV